jgi:DHA1 family tetracycline resistance protein-like MFS transporter
MEKFGWKIKDVGLSLTCVGICIALIQGALAGTISKKLGNIKTAYLSIIITIFTMILIGTVTKSWMIYCLMLPYAFSGLADPAIRAILSNKTSESEQGELQGVITSVLSIAEILGPPIMMAIFYFFTVNQQSPIYGMPFYFGAFIVTIALILFYRIVRKEN